MDRRKWSVLLALFAFAASLIISWYLVTFEEETPEQAGDGQAAEVSMMDYEPRTVRSLIQFTGRVIPQDQFELFAEVTGVFERTEKPFKTGTSFQEGEPIIEINSEEQTQQLQAARYEFLALIYSILPDINIDYPQAYDDWTNYTESFDATESLKELPQTNDRQLRLFLNNQGIFSTFANIKEQEERLSKFTLRAPYDGVVTQSNINPGALVQNGQSLGEFTRLDPIEIETSIPASEARYISQGDEVSIQTDNLENETLDARVIRKNALIEPGSQSVKIYLEISGTDLQPGSYLSGHITGRSFDNAFMVHNDILVRDDELFISEGNRARLTTIDPVAQAGDSLIIRGLDPGTKIIDEFRDAAFDGTEVTEREGQ